MLFADLLGKYVLAMDKNYLEGAALGSALQGSEVVGPFNDLREAFKALDGSEGNGVSRAQFAGFTAAAITLITAMVD